MEAIHKVKAFVTFVHSKMAIPMNVEREWNMVSLGVYVP